MKKDLQNLIFTAIEKVYGNLEISKDEIEISYPPEDFGDYSCNIGMKLAGKLKLNPFVIAETIAKEIEVAEAGKNFEKIEVVKPGFLNFKLNKKYYQQLVAKILAKKQEFGQSDLGRGKKIQVEFVSANPTGPIHLGNGRGGPMGDVLGNVFAKVGFETQKEYYVNNFGNQVKVLGHSVLQDEEAQYRGGYIDALKAEVPENFANDPFEVGQWAAGKIAEEIIRPSMEKLGIKFDNYFREKTLHESGAVQKVIEDFQKKDLVYEKDGALWFRASNFGDQKDRVVKKSTGEMTYFGSDIAYHKNKFERGFDRVINIWGADHHGDVVRVLGAVEALGYKGQLEIILSQFVRVIKDGQEFKMSKRAGTYISVDDLLQEVGKDAFRFFFLMHSADTHMDFDIQLAKEKSDKNPVFYVQYAHARMCSIFRKNEEQKICKLEKANLALLADEKEIDLIRYLNKFPELIEEIAVSYEVHKLTYYATKLADKFHAFYHDCKVLDGENEELSAARLNVVAATKSVLVEVLDLLGIEAPEKM
jgi:arginyl-tRNA synthetase